MAKIEIGFSTVVGDENFAVLEGAHGARIDVDVRIQLEHRDLEAARFEYGGEGGGSDTFAQGGNYTTRDKDKFGHFMYYRPFYYSSAIALTSSMKIACPVCISAQLHSSLRVQDTATFQPPCPDSKRGSRSPLPSATLQDRDGQTGLDRRCLRTFWPCDTR